MRTDVPAHSINGGIQRYGLLDSRLVVSRDVVLESECESHVIVVNTDSAARLQLSRSLYRFLRNFGSPHRIEDVLPGEPSDRLLLHVRNLVDKGVLIDADAPLRQAPTRLRRASAYRFCNAPRYEGVEAAADFAVLGFPYDFGADTDCRIVPAAVRQKSLEYAYEVEFESGQPRGWFDVDRGLRILQGASIVDAGDVCVEYGESQRDSFERAGRVLQQIRGKATVPVIIGGDRSVTYAVVDHLSKKMPLAVVQFAMYPAVGGGDGGASVTAEEIGSRLVRVANVDRFITLGSSGDVPYGASDSEDLVVRSAGALRKTPAAETVRELEIGCDVHLSVDLSVATPEYAQSYRGVKPHGLTLREIKELMRALGARQRIASIDMVGLDIQRESASISSVVACHLALAAMSAAYDRF